MPQGQSPDLPHGTGGHSEKQAMLARSAMGTAVPGMGEQADATPWKPASGLYSPDLPSVNHIRS